MCDRPYLFDIRASVSVRKLKMQLCNCRFFEFFSVYVMSQEFGHHNRKTTKQARQVGLVAEYSGDLILGCE